MRLSEVLGLSWADIDFVAGVIHVRHRAELAKSDFANLLEARVRPRLPAGEHLPSTRAAVPRRLQNRPQRHHRCAPHRASERRLYLTKT
jgi:integrase